MELKPEIALSVPSIIQRPHLLAALHPAIAVVPQWHQPWWLETRQSG